MSSCINALKNSKGTTYTNISDPISKTQNDFNNIDSRIKSETTNEMSETYNIDHLSECFSVSGNDKNMDDQNLMMQTHEYPTCSKSTQKNSKAVMDEKNFLKETKNVYTNNQMYEESKTDTGMNNLSTASIDSIFPSTANTSSEALPNCNMKHNTFDADELNMVSSSDHFASILSQLSRNVGKSNKDFLANDFNFILNNSSTNINEASLNENLLINLPKNDENHAPLPSPTGTSQSTQASSTSPSPIYDDVKDKKRTLNMLLDSDQLKGNLPLNLYNNIQNEYLNNNEIYNNTLFENSYLFKPNLSKKARKNQKKSPIAPQVDPIISAQNIFTSENMLPEKTDMENSFSYLNLTDKNKLQYLAADDKNVEIQYKNKITWHSHSKALLQELDKLRSGTPKDIYRRERQKVVNDLMKAASIYEKVSGIYFDKHQLRWSVGWAQGGRRIAKYFPVRIFGLEQGYKLAVQCKKEKQIPLMADILLSEFEKSRCITSKTETRKNTHDEKNDLFLGKKNYKYNYFNYDNMGIGNIGNANNSNVANFNNISSFPAVNNMRNVSSIDTMGNVLSSLKSSLPYNVMANPTMNGIDLDNKGVNTPKNEISDDRLKELQNWDNEHWETNEKKNNSSKVNKIFNRNLSNSTAKLLNKLNNKEQEREKSYNHKLFESLTPNEQVELILCLADAKNNSCSNLNSKKIESIAMILQNIKQKNRI